MSCSLSVFASFFSQYCVVVLSLFRYSYNHNIHIKIKRKTSTFIAYKSYNVTKKTNCLLYGVLLEKKNNTLVQFGFKNRSNSNHNFAVRLICRIFCWTIISVKNAINATIWPKAIINNAPMICGTVSTTTPPLSCPLAAFSNVFFISSFAAIDWLNLFQRSTKPNSNSCLML